MAEKVTEKKATKASTVKVKLSCRYGDKQPNEIVTLKSEKAKELLELNVATKV